MKRVDLNRVSGGLDLNWRTNVSGDFNIISVDESKLEVPKQKVLMPSMSGMQGGAEMLTEGISSKI